MLEVVLVFVVLVGVVVELEELVVINEVVELAEVVGKWVWIQFAGKQPFRVTQVLAELGFHWNNTRQTWQHPCGTISDERATYDPRKRYGSYFAADVKPV